MRCQIEIVFSPARPDLNEIPGMRADLGGFVYRLYTEAGAKRMGGSINTLDPLAALARAKAIASSAGFTEWRSWNAGGPFHTLQRES